MKRFKLFIMIAFAIMILAAPLQGLASSLRAGTVLSETTVVNVAKALPATTQGPIFTVAGGPIEILSFTGEVTTVIQTQPNTIKIVVDPTTPSTDTDICEELNITADAVGTIYSCVTSIATALAEYTNGVGPGMGGVFTIIAPIGQIEVNAQATNTGNITWRMRYRPLAAGVSVSAN